MWLGMGVPCELSTLRREAGRSGASPLQEGLLLSRSGVREYVPPALGSHLPQGPIPLGSPSFLPKVTASLGPASFCLAAGQEQELFFKCRKR